MVALNAGGRLVYSRRLRNRKFSFFFKLAVNVKVVTDDIRVEVVEVDLVIVVVNAVVVNLVVVVIVVDLVVVVAVVVVAVVVVAVVVVAVVIFKLKILFNLIQFLFIEYLLLILSCAVGSIVGVIIFSCSIFAYCRFYMNRSYNTVSNKKTILTVIFKRLRSLFGKEIFFNIL